MRIRDMPRSDAQKRATDKYNKENIRQFVLKLNKKTDCDVIVLLDSLQESKQGYIKRLIREDIERQKEKE